MLFVRFHRTGYLPSCTDHTACDSLVEVFLSNDVGTVKGIHEIPIHFAMHPLQSTPRKMPLT